MLIQTFSIRSVVVVKTNFMTYTLQTKNILKAIITIGMLYILYSVATMSSHVSFSTPVDPTWDHLADTAITK